MRAVYQFHLKNIIIYIYEYLFILWSICNDGANVVDKSTQQQAIANGVIQKIICGWKKQ